METNQYAILSKKGNFTSFKYGDRDIRFKAPHSLEKYTEVKLWKDGYIVVMAKYKHNNDDEEEYIDLIPILNDLYVDPKKFLKPIKKIIINND